MSLQVLPMALFARVPGNKRAKLCDPCEQALQKSEQDGSPRRCRICRQVRPLAEFPGDSARAHGLLCAGCLAVLRQRRPETQPSFIASLPPAAFFVSGLCSDPGTISRVGHVWTSDLEADRQLARQLCRSCEVSLLCADWSLNLPRDDPAIYAAMGRAERIRLRKTAAA